MQQKIVLFGNRIPPEYSGIGYRAIKHGKHLKKKEQLAFLLTTTYPHDDVDIKTVALPFGRSSSLSKFLKKFKLFELITFFFQSSYTLGKRAGSFSILHSLKGGIFSSIFVLLGKLMNFKTVIEVTLPPPEIKEGTRIDMANYLRIWSWKHADALIGISPDIYSYFGKYNIETKKCHLIPNGVNTSRFKPATKKKKNRLREKYRLPIDAKVLILVGPVIKRKGPDIAIKIYKKLKQYDKNYKLILLGEKKTKDEKDLFEENEEFFINESKMGNVLSPGLTDKVEDYLQLSDIFIFPTRKEGLGNAPLEAMACGLPVIANRLEGVTDYYVKGGVNGFLVSDNRKEDYVNQILNLMNDSSEYKRISDNAVRWIKDNISENIIYQQYQEIYDKL